MLSSSRPQPSRSFRPTRLLAAGHCSGSLHGGESRRITKNGRRRAGGDGCASILFAFNVVFCSVISPCRSVHGAAHARKDPPQPGLSRSFRPTRSWTVLLLLFPPLTSSFHHCLDSVGHSGPLGLWLPALALLLSIIFTFFHSLDSVGHSGPLGPVLSSFFPSLLFPLPVTTALTQPVIPAHSVSGFLSTCFHFSFLGFLVFPLPPRLSRSFRPTRSLATSSLFPSSAFLSSFSL